MLTEEGNENGDKTTIGLISKKQLCTRSTHSLYISLPLFCTTATWNFQRLPSYTFYGGNVVRVLVFFFTASLLLIFTLVAASISHLLTAATKLSCCFSNKNCLLCFLSLALALCCSFSRWALLTCRLRSRFLCLSVSLHSKFVDTTINLSLIL